MNLSVSYVKHFLKKNSYDLENRTILDKLYSHKEYFFIAWILIDNKGLTISAKQFDQFKIVNKSHDSSLSYYY